MSNRDAAASNSVHVSYYGVAITGICTAKIRIAAIWTVAN